jgi:phosphoserine phosphatase
MASVLVLIAAPGAGAITPHVVAAIRDHGGGAPLWLSPGDALEVAVFPQLPAFLAGLHQLPIDANTVSIHNRRKRLLVADMDSTMIHQECIDELGVVAGVGDRIADITRKAMRGELDFDGAIKERVGLLKGLDENVIAHVLREKITYMEGGTTLLATMKATGAYTALISGGFTAFTSHVAAHFGFDENHANTLLIEHGKLTGKVALQSSDSKPRSTVCIDSRINVAWTFLKPLPWATVPTTSPCWPPRVLVWHCMPNPTSRKAPGSASTMVT